MFLLYRAVSALVSVRSAALGRAEEVRPADLAALQRDLESGERRIARVRAAERRAGRDRRDRGQGIDAERRCGMARGVAA